MTGVQTCALPICREGQGLAEVDPVPTRVLRSRTVVGRGREAVPVPLLARRREAAAGGTLHVGNMDQSPPSVRNVPLLVKFFDGNGSTKFEGVDWYWITTGVSRAVRGGVDPAPCGAMAGGASSRLIP